MMMNKFAIAVVMVVSLAASGSAEFKLNSLTAGDLKGMAVAEGFTIPAGFKGYVKPVTPALPTEWVSITGGRFAMGTSDRGEGYEDAKPVHEVAIKTFQMSRTDVTVEQYAECFFKGSCTEPGTGLYCNWGQAGRELHPVNCVNWNQATQYAKFKGARLPSESEWEYAATSGGKNQKYPWGNNGPACDKAVMNSTGEAGCGANSTLPVCSKPAGNTEQGLCDMAGNVWQWVQDTYQDSYINAPADGGAVGAESSLRVLRGGGFNALARSLRADVRESIAPRFSSAYIGFRLARE